jgi:MFS family permease
MGIIGAAFGAGMVVGPMIGGVTAEVGDKYPFYSVAVLASVNFAVAWIRLPESRPAHLGSPGWAEFRRSLIPAPLRLVAAVHDRRIGLYLYLFFHLFTAFAVLESLVTLYVGLRFGIGALGVSAIFAWIGVVLFITQGILLRRLVVRFGETRLIVAGLIAMTVGLAGVALAPSYGWFFAIGPVIALGNGLTFPTFTALYSKACEAEQAGELLGQSQSMATTGRILGPIVGGIVMQSWALGTPFLVAAAMTLIALLMFRAARRTLIHGLV